MLYPLPPFGFRWLFGKIRFWGMAAIQNIWVVAWAMLTFWRLSRADKYWWWALPTAFMGLFTSGNGVLIFPLALGILLLQKRWKITAIWLIFSILSITLYFWDYQSPPTDLSASSGIRAMLHSYVLFCGSLAEGLPFGNFPYQMPIWIGRLTLFVSLSMLLYILRSYWKTKLRTGLLRLFLSGRCVVCVGNWTHSSPILEQDWVPKLC
jgi:hypothetical protein